MTNVVKDSLIKSFKECMVQHEELHKINNEIIENLKKTIELQQQTINEFKKIFLNNETS